MLPPSNLTAVKQVFTHFSHAAFFLFERLSVFFLIFSHFSMADVMISRNRPAKNLYQFVSVSDHAGNKICTGDGHQTGNNL